MARRRRITRKKIDGLLDLLDRIENELPSRSLTTASEEEEEEELDFEDTRGIEVDDIDVVIDLAVLEFQQNGILPKIKKGTYSLSAVFETLFGESSPVVELATDLETTLSGYQDMIWNDEVESALVLIREIRAWIKQETKDGASAIGS